MQHNIDTAKLTIGLIASSVASIFSASASAVAFTDQLNQTRTFLYLNIPIWVFFFAVLLLSMVGSVASLLTDIYTSDMEQRPSVLQQMFHLTGGFFSGIIGAFVLLPALTDAASPPIEVMLMTALVMSFSGVVLINNLGDLKRDKELQDSVRKLLISRVSWLANIFTKGNGDR